jgi:hypothetical protein
VQGANRALANWPYNPDSSSASNMNKRPQFGSEEGAGNVGLWVFNSNAG